MNHDIDRRAMRRLDPAVPPYKALPPISGPTAFAPEEHLERQRIHRV